LSAELTKKRTPSEQSGDFAHWEVSNKVTRV